MISRLDLLAILGLAGTCLAWIQQSPVVVRSSSRRAVTTFVTSSSPSAAAVPRVWTAATATLPTTTSTTRLASTSSSDETASSSNKKDTPETSSTPIDRTSFDEAGASLMDEADQKRMEDMGDFDANPAYQDDSIERMRAAIRERTSNLGIEKSQVSADYIKSRQAAAQQGGSAAAADELANANMFGGLDLSKISSDGSNAAGRGGGGDQWDEDMPTMFYDPEEEMTVEEREEVDPIMTKNPVEQGLNELQNAKWPDFASAGREVVLMAIVVAFSAVLIIGADNLLRGLYTNVGFIPNADDLANYASRFDGLDLPTGWTDNMSESDVASFADKVNSVVPSATTTGGDLSGLPELSGTDVSGFTEPPAGSAGSLPGL